MEYLMLISLSLDSLLSFFVFCLILSIMNFLAFCIDYGALLHLLNRYPLSTLPRFMWSARMGYPVPFTLGLTELTLVGYLTVYTVTGTNTVTSTSTSVYARPSLWRVYFWVFLFQRDSRLAALLRSPLVNLGRNIFASGQSGTTTNVISGQRLHLIFGLLCAAAWFYLACVLRWTGLVHHTLVAHSFLICLYTSRLVQWSVDSLMTIYVRPDVKIDRVPNQLDCSTFCLHLIPASVLPYFWSPQSGPARFQWVIELFLLLLVHLYDNYWYDNALLFDQPFAQTHSSATQDLFCALCLRRRHRTLTAFAISDASEPAMLPCQHSVHQACYRIWQAIAPECARCKLLSFRNAWVEQNTSKFTSSPPYKDDVDGDQTSGSWSSDSLDRASSVVSSASSEMSVYDDKDVDLGVYLDWSDVEQGSAMRRSLPPRMGPRFLDDSSSTDDMTTSGVNDRDECSSIGSTDAITDPTMSFWLPSG